MPAYLWPHTRKKNGWMRCHCISLTRMEIFLDKNGIFYFQIILSYISWSLARRIGFIVCSYSKFDIKQCMKQVMGLTLASARGRAKRAPLCSSQIPYLHVYRPIVTELWVCCEPKSIWHPSWKFGGQAHHDPWPVTSFIKSYQADYAFSSVSTPVTFDLWNFRRWYAHR